MATVGIIGALGDMGRMYALHLSQHLQVHVCDRPERLAELREVYRGSFSSFTIVIHAMK